MAFRERTRRHDACVDFRAGFAPNRSWRRGEGLLVSDNVILLGRGGRIDGQQRQLFYLSTRLNSTTTRPTVLLGEGGDLADRLIGAGVPTFIRRQSPWRSIFRMAARRRDERALFSSARDIRPLLIHAHDVWRAEYARSLALRLGVPYVVHVRGPLSPRDISKHRLKLADAIVSIAQRYVDDLLAAGLAPDRVHLIDDAVDTELFHPSHADASGLRTALGGGKIIVGIVGRVSRDKQIDRLILAAARLPQALRSRTVFAVVGEWEDPAYRRTLEAEIARLGLTDMFAFLGRTSGEDMPALLSGLDALITLSGGSVMFEAMAMGRPVISVREDGRHSQHTIHGRTAWCVTSGDPDAIAAAIALLPENEDLFRTLAAAGLAHVQGHLGVDRMVAETRALYHRLAGAATAS